VELMDKDKGYNSSHVYCHVKGWSKNSCEIFSNDFENGMTEGEKMGSYKKDFEVAMFFSSQNIDSPFYLKRLLELFFFFLFFSFLFFNTFSLSPFFNAPSL
jgi:hypothetical protein